MQIGYFFNAIATPDGNRPHTVVTVRPLSDLPGKGIEPLISITVPIPSPEASVQQIGEAALRLARQLVPESAFAAWAQSYSAQMQQRDPMTPISDPLDASELLMDARFPSQP